MVLLCSLVIGLDQYLAIVTPLRYHSIVDHTRLVWLCLTVWSLALLLPLTSLTTTVPPLLPSLHCQPSQEPSSTQALQISLAVILLILPYLGIVTMHLIIFNSARTNSVRIRRNSTSSTTGSMMGRETQYLQGEIDRGDQHQGLSCARLFSRGGYVASTTMWNVD